MPTEYKSSGASRLHNTSHRRSDSGVGSSTANYTFRPPAANSSAYPDDHSYAESDHAYNVHALQEALNDSVNTTDEWMAKAKALDAELSVKTKKLREVEAQARALIDRSESLAEDVEKLSSDKMKLKTDNLRLLQENERLRQELQAAQLTGPLLSPNKVRFDTEPKPPSRGSISSGHTSGGNNSHSNSSSSSSKVKRSDGMRKNDKDKDKEREKVSRSEDKINSISNNSSIVDTKKLAKRFEPKPERGGTHHHHHSTPSSSTHSKSSSHSSSSKSREKPYIEDYGPSADVTILPSSSISTAAAAALGRRFDDRYIATSTSGQPIIAKYPEPPTLSAVPRNGGMLSPTQIAYDGAFGVGPGGSAAAGSGAGSGTGGSGTGSGSGNGNGVNGGHVLVENGNYMAHPLPKERKK